MYDVIATISFAVALSTLISLAIYDLKHYILPDVLNATLAIVFVCFHLSTKFVFISPVESIAGAIAGGGVLLLIRAAANRYYQEDALGLGDVKLMAAAGIGLGFPNVMLAMSLGAGIGLVHGILMGLAERYRTKRPVDFTRVNVPAGLGLCLAVGIVMAVQFGSALTGLWE